jgi:hypothetical protein
MRYFFAVVVWGIFSSAIAFAIPPFPGCGPALQVPVEENYRSIDRENPCGQVVIDGLHLVAEGQKKICSSNKEAIAQIQSGVNMIRSCHIQDNPCQGGMNFGAQMIDDALATVVQQGWPVYAGMSANISAARYLIRGCRGSKEVKQPVTQEPDYPTSY